MQFEFATATRIIFGTGSSQNLAKIAAELGHHALVLTAYKSEPIIMLIDQLRQSGLQITEFEIQSEPTIDLINQGKAIASAAGCDMVISIGGGSVIDTGKAVAALIPNEGDVLDYVEVIGRGQKLLHGPIPFIAMPTTAGTGAEVTKNAVIESPEHRVKVSLRDNRMLPAIALLDPALTYSMPPSITASTGMDALTQVLEPFISHLANPITDALCRQGLALAGRSLRIVYDHADDVQAREDMALVSLLGGLALANAKLGAVHGFAGVLGGMYHAPHGAVCAALLPHTLRVNQQALAARDPHNPSLARLDEIGKLITAKESANAQSAIDWIDETSALFHIPGLASYDIASADFDDIVAKSAQSSSMKGNPITLTHAEMTAILKAAL